MSFYDHPLGVQAPSVTTILHNLAGEGLFYWQLNKAMEMIGEQDIDVSDKRNHIIVRRKLENLSTVEAAMGTWLHTVAEKRLLGRLPIGSKWPPIGINKTLQPFEEQLQLLVANLDLWLLSIKGYKTIRVEQAVHGVIHHENGKPMYFSGTADDVLELNGKVTLLDLKTSKDIYDNYAAQVAAYGYAWNNSGAIRSQGLPKIQRLQVVRINKLETGKPFYILDVNGDTARLAWDLFKSSISQWYIRSGRWGDILDG